MAFEEALFDKHGAELADSSSDGDVTGWVALGWFAVVVLGSALVAALSLPSVRSSDNVSAVSDVVRFDWLILATFLAYPIRNCARARSWLGLVAFVVAGAQSFSVVDTATERLVAYDVHSAAPTLFWLVPVVQLACFSAFAVAGSRARLAERRWQRLTAKLVRNAPRRRPVRR